MTSESQPLHQPKQRRAIDAEPASGLGATATSGGEGSAGWLSGEGVQRLLERALARRRGRGRGRFEQQVFGTDGAAATHDRRSLDLSIYHATRVNPVVALRAD